MTATLAFQALSLTLAKPKIYLARYILQSVETNDHPRSLIVFHIQTDTSQPTGPQAYNRENNGNNYLFLKKTFKNVLELNPSNNSSIFSWLILWILTAVIFHGKMFFRWKIFLGKVVLILSCTNSRCKNSALICYIRKVLIPILKTWAPSMLCS